MHVRSHLLLPMSAIVLAFALATPAAFADDMSKGSMSKDTGSKMSGPKSGDHMSKMPNKSGMKKDGTGMGEMSK